MTLFFGQYSRRGNARCSKRISLPRRTPNARKTLVQAAVDAARMHLDDAPAVARAIASNVVALYGDNADLKAQVDKARHIVDEFKKKPR